MIIIIVIIIDLEKVLKAGDIALEVGSAPGYHFCSVDVIVVKNIIIVIKYLSSVYFVIIIVFITISVVVIVVLIGGACYSLLQRGLRVYGWLLFFVVKIVNYLKWN